MTDATPPLAPPDGASLADRRRRARRELLKMALVLGGLAAIIAIAWGPVGRFFDPPDTPLQEAVRAGDMAAVRAHLGPADAADAATIAYDAYELALRSLSPPKPETVQILTLILEREPQPHRYTLLPIGTPERVRAADLEFTVVRRNQSSTSVSAVEIAAQQWSADGVRQLLARGLSVKSVGVSGALTAAAANGCEPAIRLLLDAGADVNAPDRKRDTPLAMAQRTNHVDIARLLIARGAR